MAYRYHTADVFTDVAFGGNQLAVLPDARGLSTEQMQQITREFNFSETVFVLPPDDPSHTRKVRIFTPGAELPFAGHPTVGCAYVLASTGEIKLDGDETRIVFEEGVGAIPVLIRSNDGKPAFAQLTAARIPEKSPQAYDAATIASAISLSVDDIDTDGPYAIEAWSAGLFYLFVPLRTLNALARSRIKLDQWEATLGNTFAPEVYVFVEEDESRARNGVASGNATIRSRMFAPNLGVSEDPATGSAAASFGGFLAARSSLRNGTLRHTIHQGVEMGRPSTLELEVDVSDSGVSAVRVGGASVLVASGELHVP